MKIRIWIGKHLPVRGFTWWELALVICIILFLAIYLKPQIHVVRPRTSVSISNSYMRSLTGAVEAYFNDNQAYPIPSDISGRLAAPGVTEPFLTRSPSLLTTPVAYLNGLFNDPFVSRKGASLYFRYGARPYFQAHDAATSGTTERQFDAYLKKLGIQNPSEVEYYFLSPGPDRDIESPCSSSLAIYDPTNGEVSNGDIIRVGPKREHTPAPSPHKVQ